MTSEWYMDDPYQGVSENTRRREMKFSSPRLSVSFVDNGFPVGKASWIVGEPTLEIEWDDARPPSEIPIQNLSCKDLQTLFLDTVSNHVIGVSENSDASLVEACLVDDETFYCGAPVEGYDNRWDSPIVAEPDAEFELLLSSEHDELKSVIAHHEQVFQSISALCILWQNGVMDANKVLKSIQNIVD